MTTYNLQETPIGTWVDGRTIYRMVIDYSDTPSDDQYHTFPYDFNPDFFIYMDAIGIDTSTSAHHRPFTYNSVNGNQGRFMFYDKTEKRIYTQHYDICPILYLILEYVKENDEE